MIKNILVIISVFHFSLSSQTIDYSDLKNWAAHSLKKDFSDSISAPFNEMKIDGRVDVFFCTQLFMLIVIILQNGTQKLITKK